MQRGPELPRALGFDGSLESLVIERQFPTDLRGTPPTLDAVLALSGRRLVAIESKFTEWMTKQRPRLADFRAKYLAPGDGLWATRGLPACQQLAADIAAGTESFRQLDALQLLKHALGLAVSAGRPFALLYLWFDDGSNSAAAILHRAELSCFASRVDAALDFRALRYQVLFAALEAQGDPAYIDYLRRRYFPGPSAERT